MFAVGFFARPVGAWLMGLYSDRAGRKAALMLSVALMCGGSLVIALTPPASMIGNAAPVILLLARIFQGISLGGEYGASATYLSEAATRRYRGFWSSFSYVTLIGGQLVALGVLILLGFFLTPSQMLSFGWRVPFLIGAVLAVVAWWLRRAIPESASFEKAAGARRGGVRDLLKQFPRETCVVLGLSAGGALLFYVYTTYMQKYLTNTAGFSKGAATEISAAALVVFMLVQPLFGWMSDLVGRRVMILIAFGGGLGLTYPLMTSIGVTHSPATAFWLIVAGMLIQSGYTSISALFKAELFPTTIRSLGVALPYALANALFGGTAEYAALAFKDAGHENGFYVYASLVSALSFVAALALKDTRRHSRILED